MPTAEDGDVRGWLDRLAIADLIHRYADAVTRADWDQCEAVYAPDAVWESPALGLRHEGARQFVDFLKESTARSEVLIQTAHSPIVRLAGSEQAQATTTIHEFVRGANAQDNAYGPVGARMDFEQYGVYYDDVAKRDGEWRFTHRLFVPLYVRPDTIAGQLFAARSSLARLDQTSAIA